MARNLSTGAIAQLLAGHCQPIFLVSIQFVSTTEYVWTGIGNLVWNGQTWQGLGEFGNISAIGETADVNALNITLTLSGVPSDLLGYAMSECRINYPVTIWVGFLAPDGTVVADPYKCWNGALDVPTIEEGGETSTISITAENSLVDMGRAPNRRFTDADQKRDYPNDDGFVFVPGCVAWDGTWGSPGPGNSAGGPQTNPPGSGNPGGCFTENTLIETPDGHRAICTLTPGDLVRTETGLRRIAEVLVHPNERVLDMGNGEGVTHGHLVRHCGVWVPAMLKFTHALKYTGPVYNLHIDSTREKDLNFLLANGVTAHNMKVNVKV